MPWRRIGLVFGLGTVLLLTTACTALSPDIVSQVIESEPTAVEPTQAMELERTTVEPTDTSTPAPEEKSTVMAQRLAPTPLASPLNLGQRDELVRGEAPQPLLDAIIADAVARTGYGVDEFSVIGDQAVVWPDGALGCPEPGMVYTQALVEGYHVVLEARGERFDYRVGHRDQFRLCPRPGPVSGTDTTR